MHTLIYFAHIPKTAGSTFSSILDQNFRSGYINITHAFHEGQMPLANFNAHLDRQPGAKVIGGHRVSFNVPYDRTDYDVRCVAFVRDPVDRLVSEFFYVRKVNPNGKIAKCGSLEAFVEHLETNPGEARWYFNTQWHCACLEMDTILSRMEAGKLFVLPTENFDRSLLILRKALPMLRDVSYVARNRNQARPRTIPEDLKQRILRMNEQDSALYEASLKQYNRLLSELGSPEELASMEKRFQRACNIRKHIINPIQIGLRALSNRVKSIPLPH